MKFRRNKRYSRKRKTFRRKRYSRRRRSSNDGTINIKVHGVDNVTYGAVSGYGHVNVNWGGTTAASGLTFAIST